MAKQNDLVGEIEGLAEAQIDGPVYQSVLNDPRKQRAKARRIEAMSLRLAGLTYEQIGDRLDIGQQAARELVDRNLERADNRAVASLREIENARLDRAQAAIWTKVLEGDLKATDTFLKISARRAKLNGLDAPTQITLSTHVKVEMETALSELQHLVMSEVVDAEVIEDEQGDSGETSE